MRIVVLRGARTGYSLFTWFWGPMPQEISGSVKGYVATRPAGYNQRVSLQNYCSAGSEDDSSKRLVGGHCPRLLDTR